MSDLELKKQIARLVSAMNDISDEVETYIGGSEEDCFSRLVKIGTLAVYTEDDIKAAREVTEMLPGTCVVVDPMRELCEVLHNLVREVEKTGETGVTQKARFVLRQHMAEP